MASGIGGVVSGALNFLKADPKTPEQTKADNLKAQASAQDPVGGVVHKKAAESAKQMKQLSGLIDG
jgi:hypothetical protein